MLLPPRVDHASLRVSLSVAVNATLHGQAWLGDLCGYCRRPGADAVKASLRPGDLLIHGALKRFIRLVESAAGMALAIASKLSLSALTLRSTIMTPVQGVSKPRALQSGG